MNENNQHDNTEMMDRTPSLRVVERVADAEGIDPSELDSPLYDAIDPAALDTLLAASTDDSTTSVCITFQYYGYEVSVNSNGQVKLR